MQRSLVLWLALVFGALAAMLGLTAIATGQVFVFAIVLPFAASAYFMWLQGSGRLRERLREQARQEAYAERQPGGTFGAGPRETGGRGARAREARERGAGGRFAGEGPFGADDGPFGSRRARGPRAGPGPRPPREGGSGPSVAEAADTLDVSPNADEATVRAAYRERVKEVHPDSGGDEAEFRAVNDAYEVLREHAS